MRPIAGIVERMALSTAPNDTEEGRAFLQQRLALFGKSAFLLFVGVGLVGAIVMSIVVTPERLRELRRAPPVHVLPVFGVVISWLVCRRGHRSLRLLAGLDAAVTVMVGIGFGLVVVVAPPELLPAMPATLCVTYLLIARAVVVPSDWVRTLWISLFTAATPAALIYALGFPTTSITRVWAILLPFWCFVAAAVATWTSHVIYRLRRRVMEARRLGQYTLEDQIGEGGMGVVFRARHALLRRPTVVKLLPPEKAGQANLARFEREVQLTSQLSCPNTVAVYDFGRTPDGTFYYAMEYLDGVDLDALVAQHGPQPPARVIRMMLQVCRALAEAHDCGLVHRDIKPGNVMMCRHGGRLDVIKVLDFGLVKDVTGSSDVKLTHADAFIGTPLFLSPEAINQPETVDARSDLYSLGGLGYFLLTGRPVFTGRTVAELCAQHLYEAPVPPSRRVADVPGDLEEILLACLEKSPDRRPQDARILRARLLACADAGRWTDDDARAWWESRASGEHTPIASAPTLPDARRARPA